MKVEKKLWKEGKHQDAFDKWQKAIRYLDYHPEFSTYPLPEDPNGEDSAEDSNTKDPNAEEKRRFQELLSPLLLNSALAATKNPRQVITLTNRALLFALSNADRAKGLYRRARARVALKEEEEAEKDLVSAVGLSSDPAISSLLEEVKGIRKKNQERQKARFKSMFSNE